MTGHELRNYREGLRIPLAELANELRASPGRLGAVETLPEVPAPHARRVVAALRRIHAQRAAMLELAEKDVELAR